MDVLFWTALKGVGAMVFGLLSQGAARYFIAHPDPDEIQSLNTLEHMGSVAVVILLLTVALPAGLADARTTMQHRLRFLAVGRVVTARLLPRGPTPLRRGHRQFRLSLPADGAFPALDVTATRKVHSRIKDDDTELALHIRGEGNPVFMDDFGFEPRVQPDGTIIPRRPAWMAMTFIVTPLLMVATGCLYAMNVAQAWRIFFG